MAAIPPAPPLPGEARLEVFVFPGALLPDRSLEEDNKFSDAYRLEFLGKKMSELAYMEVLRNRWPKVTSQQLRTMFSSRISGVMERTAAAYKWVEYVRGYPNTMDRNNPQESHRLFRTYSGAVYVEHGFETLRDWIAALDPV